MSRVLVVDDEADIRQLARMILELAGHEVVEADDGAAALATVEACDVDVMLLDLRMAGVDGWAVLDRLAATGRLPGLPVVAISAHADPQLMRATLAKGCRSYMAKPFSPADLLSMVAAVGKCA